jgi:hypothetical protein
MNLDDAEKLLAWMRENGVVSARVGELTLTLGEQPAQPYDPSSPWAQYLREKGKPRKEYASPEDDPDLYGREPPGLED